MGRQTHRTTGNVTPGCGAHRAYTNPRCTNLTLILTRPGNANGAPDCRRRLLRPVTRTSWQKPSQEKSQTTITLINTTAKRPMTGSISSKEVRF